MSSDESCVPTIALGHGEGEEVDLRAYVLHERELEKALCANLAAQQDGCVVAVAGAAGARGEANWEEAVDDRRHCLELRWSEGKNLLLAVPSILGVFQCGKM